MVDWTKPLEAFHADGRIAPMTVKQAFREPFETNECPNGEETNQYWYSNGRDYCTSSDGWRIRNVTPNPAPIPAAITDRAMALVRRMANPGSVDHTKPGYVSCIDEARAILDALNPVSVDEKVAAEIAMTNSPDTFPTDTCDLAEWVAKGIAKGRSLERSGE